MHLVHNFMALPRVFLTIQLIFVLCYAFVRICALNNVNAKRGSRKHNNFMRGLFSTALRLSGMRDTLAWHVEGVENLFPIWSWKLITQRSERRTCTWCLTSSECDCIEREKKQSSFFISYSEGQGTLLVDLNSVRRVKFERCGVTQRLDCPRKPFFRTLLILWAAADTHMIRLDMVTDWNIIWEVRFLSSALFSSISMHAIIHIILVYIWL